MCLSQECCYCDSHHSCAKWFTQACTVHSQRAWKIGADTEMKHSDCRKTTVLNKEPEKCHNLLWLLFAEDVRIDSMYKKTSILLESLAQTEGGSTAAMSSVWISPRRPRGNIPLWVILMQKDEQCESTIPLFINKQRFTQSWHTPTYPTLLLLLLLPLRDCQNKYFLYIFFYCKQEKHEYWLSNGTLVKKKNHQWPHTVQTNYQN